MNEIPRRNVFRSISDHWISLFEDMLKTHTDEIIRNLMV